MEDKIDLLKLKTILDKYSVNKCFYNYIIGTPLNKSKCMEMFLLVDNISKEDSDKLASEVFNIIAYEDSDDVCVLVSNDEDDSMLEGMTELKDWV